MRKVDQCSDEMKTVEKNLLRWHVRREGTRWEELRPKTTTTTTTVTNNTIKIDPNNREKQHLGVLGASLMERLAGGGAAPSPRAPHRLFFVFIRPSPSLESQQQQITLSKLQHNNHKQQQHQFETRARQYQKSMQTIEQHSKIVQNNIDANNREKQRRGASTTRTRTRTRTRSQATATPSPKSCKTTKKQR